MDIINNKRAFRFETIDNDPAFIEYRWLKGAMVLMHTFVPAAMRGKGTAGKLAGHVLQHARQHGLKVIIYCPFIEKYIQKHIGYADLVLEKQR